VSVNGHDEKCIVGFVQFRNIVNVLRTYHIERNSFETSEIIYSHRISSNNDLVYDDFHSFRKLSPLKNRPIIASTGFVFY